MKKFNIFFINFIIMVCLVGSVSAVKNVIFSDNFNRADVGTDYTYSGATSVQIDGNTLKITDESTGSAPELLSLNLTEIGLPMKFNYSVLYYISDKLILAEIGLSNATGHDQYSLNDADAGIRLRSSNEVRLTSNTVVSNYAIENWYNLTVEVDRTAKTYTLWIDGTLEGSDVTFINSDLSSNIVKFAVSGHESTTGYSIFIDDLIFWNYTNAAADTIPTVNLLYPNSTTNFWSDSYIKGTCSDPDGIINVSVNDTRFIFNTSSNFTDWIFNYIGNLSYEPLYLNITCYDSLGINGSQDYSINVDVVTPSCNFNTPVTLSEKKVYYWNVTCIDDLNLYSLEINCSGGTNYYYYNKDLNTTSYNFINNTFIDNATVCKWVTTDAHTKDDITKQVNIHTIKVKDNKVRYKNFNYIELDNNINVDNFSLIFDTIDRVRFKVTKKGKKADDLIFYVNANHTIDYINNNKYTGWFVVDGYLWIDFENDNNINAEVYRINAKQYKVIIPKCSDIKFKSIGIINTNKQTQTFKIVNKTLPFQVDISTVQGALILFVLAFLYVSVMFIGFYFNNNGFISLGFFVGVGLGLALASIHIILTLAFILINVMISMAFINRNN